MPGISGLPERKIDSAALAEFVQVLLSQQNRPCGVEPLNNSRVVRRKRFGFIEHTGPECCWEPLRMDLILDAVRQSVERPPIGATRNLIFGLPGLFKRKLWADID